MVWTKSWDSFGGCGGGGGNSNGGGSAGGSGGGGSIAATTSRKSITGSSSGSGGGSSSSSSSTGVGARNNSNSNNNNNNSNSPRPDLLCGPKQSYQLSHWWMLTTFLTPLREQDLTYIASTIHQTLLQTNLTTLPSDTTGFPPFLSNGNSGLAMKKWMRKGRGSPIIQQICSCTRILSVLLFARSEVGLASPFNTMNPPSSTSINSSSGISGSGNSSSSGSSGMTPSQQEVLKRLVIVKDVCLWMIEVMETLLQSSVVTHTNKGYSDKDQDKDKDKMDVGNHDHYASGSGLAQGPGLASVSEDILNHHRVGVYMMMEQLLRSSLVLVVEGMAGVAQVGVDINNGGNQNTSNDVAPSSSGGSGGGSSSGSSGTSISALPTTKALYRNFQDLLPTLYHLQHMFMASISTMITASVSTKTRASINTSHHTTSTPSSTSSSSSSSSLLATQQRRVLTLTSDQSRGFWLCVRVAVVCERVNILRDLCRQEVRGEGVWST